MATVKKPARSKPQRPLHPEDARMHAQLEQALLRGTHEHYVDAEQYDHEYSKRRDDVAFYVEVAKKSMAASRGTAPPSGRKQSQGPILELGCGSGRLTMALAKAGHTVVGVDASRQMIARCASQLERKGLTDRVSLHVADFRELAGRSVLGRQKFSLVLCPFNAFQHLYERSDVEAFLDGVRAHLAPGGRFVFDLMNPDLRWLSRDSTKRWARTRFKDPRTKVPMIYSTQIVYDSPLQVAFMTIFYERVDGKGSEKRTLLTHRHFYPRELEALLHYNGFVIERREGDFGGKSLQPESEQQVLFCTVARRR